MEMKRETGDRGRQSEVGRDERRISEGKPKKRDKNT